MHVISMLSIRVRKQPSHSPVLARYTDRYRAIYGTGQISKI